MTNILRIATRQSPLALWQTKWVAKQLAAKYPELEIKILPMKTQGDLNQTKPLNQIGGKTLFVKALQQCVLDNTADIAVHSIKDMSVFAYPGLELAAICQRGDPSDAWLSAKHHSINELPQGAIVGTASPRRQALLLNTRPDLNIKCLRGNVQTRLNKLDCGEYAGIILATAGLMRLGLENRINQRLDPKQFIAAIGQGAIGIECRENDATIKGLLLSLHDLPTAHCVMAERQVNYYLNGDCHTAIGAYATIENDQLNLKAMVASLDGKTLLRAEHSMRLSAAMDLGKKTAEDLLAQGAKKVLGHK
ncbi:MAG: hydroxymethylbilane synthase [Gammaproteobacteria bacterium]|nr:hydroxymethylbilane synthase [Gammaproteobacteria bacterium]